jgi:hypothetical protein
MLALIDVAPHGVKPEETKNDSNRLFEKSEPTTLYFLKHD